MFTTHGHQIPNTTVQDRLPGHSVARCGGVGFCKTCKDESDIVQSTLLGRSPRVVAFARFDGQNTNQVLAVFGSISTYIHHSGNLGAGGERLEINKASTHGNATYIVRKDDYVLRREDGEIFVESSDYIGKWISQPQVSTEDRPEMLSEGGFIEKAKRLVRDTFYHENDGTGSSWLPIDDVYVVWFTKTLQNWKAVVSTNVKDDRIYEVTYNGDKKEAYVDAYVKLQNVCVPD